jgi:hypothetical protein
MKQLTSIFALVLLLLSLNSCSPGYVATVPEYRTNPRPPSPGGKYVWVDGDWHWNGRTNRYVQRPGSWQTPKRNRTYYPGRWETHRKGMYWQRGQWK